jgi:uncharacterized membrane protein YfcA
MNWAYTGSGFAVGLLVGMTGVGGGSLMTPLLVLLFNVHPATAVGTDLLYAAATKGVGTLVHGFKGTVDWAIAARLAAGSVPATVATLYFLGTLGTRTAGVSSAISVVLGVALLLTAVSLVFRRRLAEFASRHAGTISARTQGRLTIATGAVLGILVSLTSVGAGAIGVTVLLLLYPTLPLKRIVGADIAHAVPLTLIAGMGHWLLGSVDWSMLLALLLGSVPGIVAGSVLSSRIPEPWLRPVLAATMALVGTRLLMH